MIELNYSVIASGEIDAAAVVIVHGSGAGEAVGGPEIVEERQRERVYLYPVPGHNLRGLGNPGGRRGGSNGGQRLLIVLLLIIYEEKSVILHDGSAEREPFLVIPEFRVWRSWTNRRQQLFCLCRRPEF